MTDIKVGDQITISGYPGEVRPLKRVVTAVGVTHLLYAIEGDLFEEYCKPIKVCTKVKGFFEAGKRYEQIDTYGFFSWTAIAVHEIDGVKYAWCTLEGSDALCTLSQGNFDEMTEVTD